MNASDWAAWLALPMSAVALGHTLYRDWRDRHEEQMANLKVFPFRTQNPGEFHIRLWYRTSAHHTDFVVKTRAVRPRGVRVSDVSPPRTKAYVTTKAAAPDFSQLTARMDHSGEGVGADLLFTGGNQEKPVLIAFEVKDAASGKVAIRRRMWVIRPNLD